MYFERRWVTNESGTYPLDEISGFSGKVGWDVKLSMKNLINSSLSILSTKWRLYRKGGKNNRTETKISQISNVAIKAINF